MERNSREPICLPLLCIVCRNFRPSKCPPANKRHVKFVLLRNFKEFYFKANSCESVTTFFCNRSDENLFAQQKLIVDSLRNLILRSNPPKLIEVINIWRSKQRKKLVHQIGGLTGSPFETANLKRSMIRGVYSLWSLTNLREISTT